ETRRFPSPRRPTSRSGSRPARTRSPSARLSTASSTRPRLRDRTSPWRSPHLRRRASSHLTSQRSRSHPTPPTRYTDGDRSAHAPEPTEAKGRPLAPRDAAGHDHVWWLDRMVRGNQPLVERMTLVWHDWFATSNQGVGSQSLMLDQNELFRASWAGSFRELLL